MQDLGKSASKTISENGKLLQRGAGKSLSLRKLLRVGGGGED